VTLTLKVRSIGEGAQVKPSRRVASPHVKPSNDGTVQLRPSHKGQTRKKIAPSSRYQPSTVKVLHRSPTGIGGRPRGARNKLGEAFLQDLHADWEKHGKEVIERVRRDDPSTYLRVMANVVRPASEPELESPFAHMTYEELRAELLAGFASIFPELRVVPAQGQALISCTRDG
jgi:hypothetical protein